MLRPQRTDDPQVTALVSPTGTLRATTGCPTCSGSEVPIVMRGRSGASSVAWRTARSVATFPTTVASLIVPSEYWTRRTPASAAEEMTW